MANYICSRPDFETELLRRPYIPFISDLNNLSSGEEGWVRRKGELCEEIVDSHLTDVNIEAE